MKADLSKRECEVLELIAWGASLKEAADILDISVHTVDKEVRSIKLKKNLQKATELSAYYFCSRFNISMSLSPLPKKIASAAFVLLLSLSEFVFNPIDQTSIRIRRPRRARTEIRYSARTRAGRSSSY